MGNGSSGNEVKYVKIPKYKLVLKTLIWQEWDEGSEKQPPDKPYTGPETQTVLNIIEKALQNYKWHSWKRDQEAATVTLVISRRSGKPILIRKNGKVQQKSVDEDLHEIFGELAADTWMEGDIRVNGNYPPEELDLEIESLERLGRLGAARKADATGRKGTKRTGKRKG